MKARSILSRFILFSLLAAPVAGPLSAQGSGAGGPGRGPGCGQPTAPEHAYLTDEYDEVRRLRQRGDILPLEDILARARRYYGGRVLETELEVADRHYVYEVQLVDNQGRVRYIWLDAATGELMRAQQEK